MNQEDKLIKANARFAEFMGAELYTPKYKGFMALFNKYDKPVYIFDKHGTWTLKGLKYHLEWEWLMTIVTKIESLGYSVSIISYYTNDDITHSVSFTHKDSNTPIVLIEQKNCFPAVYLACNDFVDAYTSQVILK